jgi:hypothetical protein
LESATPITGATEAAPATAAVSAANTPTTTYATTIADTTTITRSTSTTQTTAITNAATREILPALVGSAAKLFARFNRIISAYSVKLRGRSLISIGNTFTMVRIMLPLSLTPLIGLSPLLQFLFGLVSVDISIDVGVAIDVDVDISTTPVAVAPRITPSRSHGNAGAKPHH